MKKDVKKHGGQAVKSAPKWGTAEWIVAYPHSLMDRKRRKRAERAVGAAVMSALRKGPFAWCVSDRMHSVYRDFGLRFADEDLHKLLDALVTVLAYEHAIYDAAFATALAKAWKIDPDNVCINYVKAVR